MRNKWKDWVAFQELEKWYGTFTAIAMMEDAAKTASFAGYKRASRAGIVRWSSTRYAHLWRNWKCSG